MKSLLLTLTLLTTLATAQDSPPPQDAPAETIKKAHPAAWLGIAMSENDGKVTIGQVLPGSPADKAGLKENDLLLRIGAQAIEGHMQRVSGHVSEHKPGDTIELHIQRGDKEEMLKIELGERPDFPEFEARGELRRPEKQERQEKKTRPEPKEGSTDQPLDEKTLQRWLQQYSKKPNLQDPEEMLREYLGRAHSGATRPGNWPPLFHPGKYAPTNEDAIWQRIQQSIARSLKEAALPPDVIEKTLHAVQQARTRGDEQQARRARLIAEAARLEKELQTLKEKADKIREELQKAGE